MLSRSIHSVAYISTPTLLYDWIIPYFTHHKLFIHPSIDAYLGSFYLLASALLWTYMYFYLCEYLSTSLWVIYAGSCGNSMSNLIIDLRERKREKKTLICCATYLCIHMLCLVCVLTRDQTQNHVSGRYCNQLSTRQALNFLKMWLGTLNDGRYIPFVINGAMSPQRRGNSSSSTFFFVLLC